MTTVLSPERRHASRVLHDVNRRARQPAGERLNQLLAFFSRPEVDGQAAQHIIGQMTAIVLTAAADALPMQNVLLIPVLRAGLAMWPAANQFFGFPPSGFALAIKQKGTKDVSVSLTTMPASAIQNVWLLDTVVATGDTINSVAASVHDRLSHAAIHLCTCYASPEGLAAIERADLVASTLVGVRSRTVDAKGYVVPLINGDAGDKLYSHVNISPLRRYVTFPSRLAGGSDAD